jgi:hypothetical protein
VKKFLVLLMIVLVPALAHAADPQLDRPHWSVEIKGGIFEPDLPDFEKYYDEKTMTEFAGSLAYKIIRQIEVGLSAGYLQAKGRGDAQLNNTTAGSVTYKLAPINAFVLFRGVMREEQWLIPYAGGGFTRLYYKERIEGQDTISGSVDGYHARGGLQFVLNSLDAKSANAMYKDYGVYSTSFIFEVEYTHAVVKATSSTPEYNLGGTAYIMGLLFEF